MIQEARKNEILVLNLIRERELIDRIYGCEAHERIFSGMYAAGPDADRTGLEKAINYCRYNCNNISDLPEVTEHPRTDNSEQSQTCSANASVLRASQRPRIAS
jgi:hypothetical protein